MPVIRLLIVRYRRKLNREHCTSPGQVAARDFARMLMDDAVASAEAQAGSFSDGLGCVERVEHALGVFDSGPGIHELNPRVPWRRADKYFEGAAVSAFQRVYGVGDDLQEHVQQLARVAADQGAGALFGQVHV